MSDERKDAYEKSWTPSVENVRENSYVNKKGEEKKQCFITVDPREGHECSAVFPYGKGELLEKYHNERYPDSLNIPIPRDFQFHVVFGQGDKREYKDVLGSELRRLIDYYINIPLKDAYIRPLPSREDRVSIWKNGHSVIVNADWVKEGPYGPFISVKHNAKVEISKLREKKVDGKYEAELDEEGRKQFDKKEVIWKYVNEVFKTRAKSLEEKVNETEAIRDSLDDDMQNFEKDNEVER